MTFRKKFLENRGQFQDLNKIWAAMWKKKSNIKAEGDFFGPDSVCPVEYLYNKKIFNKYNPKPLEINHINPDEFRFTERVQFFSSGDHAMIITNSRKCQGLPDSYIKRIKHIVNNKNFKAGADMLNSVTHFANICAIDDDLLPKRINPNLREQNFVREYGILPQKIFEIIVENMIANSAYTHLYKNFPDLIIDRNIVFKGDLDFEHSKRTLKYQFEVSYLLQSNKWNQNFTTNQKYIENTDCPNIFHDDPFIDLGYKSAYNYPKKENMEFNSENFSSRFDDISTKNPYGIIISNCKDSYDYGSRFSRALIITHIIARRFALKLKYTNKSLSKNPLNILCLHTDAIRFHFIFYQLNTLDLLPDSATKNYFWIDDYNYLYEKNIGPKDYWRDATVDNFSYLTASKLFSFFL